MLHRFRYMDMTPEQIEALPDPVDRVIASYQWQAQHWLLFMEYLPTELAIAEALCWRVLPLLLGK